MWCMLTFIFAAAQANFESNGTPEGRRLIPARSTVKGPIRIRYLNPGNQDVSYATQVAQNYFSHALNIYNLIDPVVVDSCFGMAINEQNVDVVIILRGPPPSPLLSKLQGLTCANDGSVYNYPIAGIIQRSNYQGTDAYFYNQLTSKIIASTIRILGINGAQMTKWRDQAGNLRNPGDMFKTLTINGVSKSYLCTPKVVEMVRELFSDDTLIGLEFENSFYISGSMFWEARHFMLEVMTLTYESDLYVAKYTLAALEDSGWYFPNYNMANIPTFGYHEGSDYFTKKCRFDNPSDVTPCTSYNDKVSPSHIFAAYCTTSYLFTEIADGCDFPNYVNVSDARYNGNKDGVVNGRGVNVRVFYGQIGQTSSLYYFEIVSCEESYVRLKYSGYYVDCPYTGEMVSVPDIPSLSIRCPTSRSLCPESIHCYHHCSGNGECLNGKCVCLDGYQGDLCSYKCPDNCLTCVSSNGCTKCLPGFWISKGLCKTCSSSCEECSSLNVCTKCKVGQYLSGSSCVNCDQTCKACSSAVVCSECNTGYHIINDFCCPDTCLSCTPNICLSCQEDNFLTVDGSCVACPAWCKKCNNNVCIECPIRQYLLDGGCSVCPDNCLRCTTSTTCDLCDDNYYLNDQKTCVLCQVSCDSCSNNECQVCSAGYFKQTPICCPDSCTDCDESQCFHCKPGRFYLAGKCEMCPTTCIDCLNGRCTDCVLGYWLNDNNCASCDTNCKGCSSEFVCTSCHEGMYLSDNTCLRCDSSCTKCTSSQICTECITGYYVVNDYCCPNSCLSCTSTACLSCKEDFYLMDGACITCPTWCKKCNNNVCIECPSKQALQGGICVDCPTNCLECSSSTYCNLCDNGYYSLDFGRCALCQDVCNYCSNNQCQSCSTGYFKQAAICCPDSCLDCNEVRCFNCKPGKFYLSGSCVECPSNCLSCANGVCESCKPGYYQDLLSDQGCSKCADSCSECSSLTHCTLCKPGFENINFACSACPDFCEICTGTTCTKCFIGNELSHGICKPDDSDDKVDQSCGGNCDECKNGVCESCSDRFYLSENKCTPCSNNCKTCLGVWECKSCDSDFNLAFGVCCPHSCSSCSTSVCYTCKPNYFLSQGKCIDCPTSCSKCLNGVCTKCENGFYISGTGCLKCADGCSNCSSLSWCNGCDKGYKMKSGKCSK